MELDARSTKRLFSSLRRQHAVAYPLRTACQGSRVTRTARLLCDGHMDSTAHTAEKLPRASSQDTHRKLCKGLVAAISAGALSVDTSVTSATNLFCFHAVTSDIKA